MNHKQMLMLSCMGSLALGCAEADELQAQMQKRLAARWGTEEAFNKLVDDLPNIDNATFGALFLEMYDQVVAGGPVLFEDVKVDVDAVGRWFDEWELTLPEDAREALRGMLGAAYKRGRKEEHDALVEEGDRQAREE